MSTRQDSLEDRLTTLEDKLGTLQEQLDLLPDLIASRIQAQVGVTVFVDLYRRLGIASVCTFVDNILPLAYFNIVNQHFFFQ